jgi:hypothetical protein
MRNVRLSGAVDWLRAPFANIAASPTAAHPSVRFVLFVERSVCYTGNWGERKTMRRTRVVSLEGLGIEIPFTRAKSRE